MNGEQALLMATDPPYLVNYQGGNHLSIEDAAKYLAWLDSGNIGRHFEALRKRAS